MATTAKELPDGRWLLHSAQGLSGTTVYSDGIAVETWTQAMVEVYPSGMTGDCEVWVEFSNGGPNGPYMAETIEDAENGTLDTNTYFLPQRRLVRTWNENSGCQIPVPVSHKFLRVGISGSDGTASIMIRKGL